MKQKFNLVLTLAAMLMMAQTALAVKVTKTVTWSLSGTSSVNTTQQDNCSDLVIGAARP